AQVARRRGRDAPRRGAPWIDVEAAATRVARLHRQALRIEACRQVDEDPLDALLVELAVVAERDQVAQQARRIDPWAGALDAHARPIRLAGDRAIGLQ